MADTRRVNLTTNQTHPLFGGGGYPTLRCSLMAVRISQPPRMRVGPSVAMPTSGHPVTPSVSSGRRCNAAGSCRIGFPLRSSRANAGMVHSASGRRWRCVCVCVAGGLFAIICCKFFFLIWLFCFSGRLFVSFWIGGVGVCFPTVCVPHIGLARGLIKLASVE